jgi:prophage regulatory protein
MGGMRYIGFPDLKDLYGIPYSWAHLARLEAAGEFPRRVRLSAKRVVWVRAEIEAWCEAREKAREAA